MGKFAGFLKRLKNIPNKIVNGLTNGLVKVNNIYKKYGSYLEPLVEAALKFIPGGEAIGIVGKLGLDKVSKTIDTLETIHNTPGNQFLPTQPSDKLNLNDIVNRNKPIFGKPINTTKYLTDTQRNLILNTINRMKK
jgi:hypothetical protein